MCGYITYLFCKKQYWQKPLTHQTNPVATLATGSLPFTVSQFNNTEFGFQQGFQIFQYLIGQQLQSYVDFAIYYFNDVLIHSNPWTELPECCFITINWHIKTNLSDKKANSWRYIISQRIAECVIGTHRIKLEVRPQRPLKPLKSS